MSFFSGGKSRAGKEQQRKAPRDVVSGPEKSQFYVEFLGWMESGGVRGRRYTDPAVQELKRRQLRTDTPPKLTLQLTPRELRISQEVEERHKPRAIRKIKFPAIPTRDVTFAVQSRRACSDRALEDVVACIYLGYMPRTGRYVHVHVYRFDGPSTASTFTRLLNDLIASNLGRIGDVERELAEQGEIEDPSLGSSDGMSEGTHHTGTDSAAESASGSGYSEDGYPTFEAEEIEEDLQSLCEVQPFDSVADELTHRLAGMKGPLLLPPKDYDTISRARGNLMDINQRRCLNLTLVGHEQGGPAAVDGLSEALTTDQRRRNVSEESGIDLASPSSDGGGGDFAGRFPSHSESESPVVAESPQGYVENGFVYPPRQERGWVPPRGLAQLGRQSSLSSAMSSHSSRGSQHSEGIRHSEERRHVYRRCHSINSFNIPTAQVGAVVQRQDLADPIDEDLLPPADYDHDYPSPRDPVARRSKPFPASSPRRASGSDVVPGGSVVMRGLPTSAMYNEVASLHSPRGRVEGRMVGEEDFVYSAQRRSQPVYPSSRPL